VETELVVSSVNADGDGVAAVSGASVALPATIPGERVLARLRRGRDGSWVGDVVKLTEASPHRVAPRCRHFRLCGGCAWQHIAYPEQLRLKQERVRELIHADVRPTLATPAPGNATPWGYRDKVSFVFGPAARGPKLVMGHYQRGSRTILPVQECPVHAETGNRFAFAVFDALQRAGISGSTPDGDRGVARHVVVRVSEGTGERLGTLVVTENVKPLRRVTADVEARLGAGASGGREPGAGFHLNVHDRPGPFLFGRDTRRLFGLDEIREQVAGSSYIVSPTAFFQTNVRAADVLVHEVLDALSGRRFRRVLDLYAGVGMFALPLAKQGRAVTAVEENRDGLSAAAAALRVNKVPPDACRLLASRVEEAAARLGSANDRWDAVVLDPPRQGCPPAVTDWVFRSLRPERVVYVSCEPEALARDLARVSGTGYQLERVQPVDMFPHTAHVETVAVLQRTEQGQGGRKGRSWEVGK
jgi:23S rRNA (uracil1939-C5)-methyltransferase